MDRNVRYEPDEPRRVGLADIFFHQSKTARSGAASTGRLCLQKRPSLASAETGIAVRRHTFVPRELFSDFSRVSAARVQKCCDFDENITVICDIGRGASMNYCSSCTYSGKGQEAAHRDLRMSCRNKSAVGTPSELPTTVNGRESKWSVDIVCM